MDESKSKILTALDRFIKLTFRTSICSISDMLLKALPDNNYEVCKLKYILQNLFIVTSNNRGCNPSYSLRIPCSIFKVRNVGLY